jgi:hypothetical protein
MPQPSTAQVPQAKSGQVQAMQAVAIPPTQQVPTPAGTRPPAPDDVQIPPLPQEQIPILQPRPQHPQSRLRYDPPPVGNAGVLHPAPAQEPAKAVNTSVTAQNPVSKPTEQQAPAVQETPESSSYHPPPLNRNRSQEENVNRAQSRNSAQASVGENPSTIYTIHEYEPPKPAGPPPPPPKIPIQNVQQSAVIFSPAEYAAGSEAASPQPQSPSGVPLPESKATSPAPSRNQSLLRQAVSSSLHAPKPPGVQDAVAVGSGERTPAVADSDSEPKSDMLVKAESLKLVDAEAEREPPATAVGASSPEAIPATEAAAAKAVEVTSPVKPEEVKAPGDKAPELTSPEMKVPEVERAEDQGAIDTSPETKGPDTTVPVLRVPEVKAPEIKAPQINAPDVKPDEEVAPSVAKPSNVEEQAKKRTPGQSDHTNAVELPAMRFGEDDEPVMKATSYPGDEWVPRWDPE